MKNVLKSTAIFVLIDGDQTKLIQGIKKFVVLINSKYDI